MQLGLQSGEILKTPKRVLQVGRLLCLTRTACCSGPAESRRAQGGAQRSSAGGPAGQEGERRRARWYASFSSSAQQLVLTVKVTCCHSAAGADDDDGLVPREGDEKAVMELDLIEGSVATAAAVALTSAATKAKVRRRY